MQKGALPNTNKKALLLNGPIKDLNKTLTPRDHPRLDLTQVKTALSSGRGPKFWRSLEQIAGTPQFEELLHREFPAGASEWTDDLSRRSFLRMAAASIALAGLNACTKQPTQEILPYVNQPTELVLGEPLFYATSMVLGGFATGALVKSREGHPIKIEGNPDHPASLGGSSVWLQASLLDLYDPDRSQSVLHNGDLSTWDRFLSDLNELITEQQTSHGSGLRFLTETVTSPTLAAQLEELQLRFPRSKWHQYEPIARDNVREGARQVFGEIVETQYRFDSAAIIVSLESDFLYAHPNRLRNARQFTDGRRISSGKREMNRLYVIESVPSVTGTIADHRLPLASRKVEQLARLLASKIGALPDESVLPLPEVSEPLMESLIQDLRNHRGGSIVIAGECQPPLVHALTHLLNERLGNVGKTIFYTKSAEAKPLNQLQSLGELVREMRSGVVEALFIIGGNPVFSAPADFGFGDLLSKVKRAVHLGLELDETAARCTWHIPATHYLESWGDARSFDGTISLIQPLIAPLYNGKSSYELLGAFMRNQPLLSDYEIVRKFWQSQNPWPDFETGWRQALHNGFVPDSAFPEKKMGIKGLETFASRDGRDRNLTPLSPSSQPANSSIEKNHFIHRETEPTEKTGLTRLDFSQPPPGSAVPLSLLESDLEICFRLEPNVWDGRFANNGWLQECPRPVNKLTWDNAALISPALAQRCGLATNDVVELISSGRPLRIPVWIQPGQADKSITLHVGQGRSRVGRVGSGVGFNAYLLRTSEFPWVASGAQLFKTLDRHSLVSTQTHHSVDSPERQVVRECNFQDFLSRPDVVRNSVEQPEPNETLYRAEEYPYTGYKWGMSIDLTSCLGCNACLVACQAENNVPFVGKEQIRRNREMFWIRIDTYYQGSLENPKFVHMPVPCMHCEHAPCELVCPVEATVHDQEGLNLQVYNRCVGTRFCSNNCPYKVRRFNFFQYSQYHQSSYKPMYNPEVTVRWRGVMEKCTYCIQRIAAARITAEKENRRILDGEIQTACQQSCPTRAISFGDLNSSKSEVARLKSSPLDYSMLGQLNTRPRTTYLAKVGNRAAGAA
jgi:molybdopterin-containing oxidoreductase family iron-sulfur binding subunit